MPDLISSVSNLLREAAETYVMPVFGKKEANPKEKSSGEWVTEADSAVEAFLEPALRSLIPGSFIVGEEAVSADPNVLDRLASGGDVWLIDPLDGTSNFAQGVAPFALMVALIRKGATIASWILDPAADQLSISEKGSGSWINAEQITVNDGSPELKDMRGSNCAGFDYPSITNGSMNFALYWRTLPWDHAPGVLFLQEAGGYAARPDGSEYLVADHARFGLLAAHNEETWARVKSTLFV